jgi:hypothetical protein
MFLFIIYDSVIIIPQHRATLVRQAKRLSPARDRLQRISNSIDAEIELTNTNITKAIADLKSKTKQLESQLDSIKTRAVETLSSAQAVTEGRLCQLDWAHE